MSRKKEKKGEGKREGQGGKEGISQFQRLHFLLQYPHCLPLNSKKHTYDLRTNLPLWLNLAQVHFYYLQQKYSNLCEQLPLGL